MAGRCNSLEKHGDRERCMLLDEGSGHFSDIERLQRAE